MEILSSTRCKELAKLLQKKYRIETGELLVEGFRLIEQIVKNNVPISEIFCLEKDVTRIKKISSAPISIAAEWQLQKMSDTKSSQDIIALLNTPHKQITENGFLLYLDNISEPGNLGTIFRTAAAFGIDGIALSPDCCEVYNPKVIRASLGAVFSIPFEIRDYDWLIKQDAQKICTAFPGKIPLNELTTVDSSVILIIGSEAEGINKKILEKADQIVFIPITEQMESLNAAMATAIAVYHIRNIKR